MPALAQSPLARRLKKHITSREHEYFAVTAPHLDKLCQKELDMILPQNETFVQPGGVTFFGRPENMYLANLYLRSATRILMRIGNFKAVNFNEFVKKMAHLNFDLYLNAETLPEVMVKTHHCRLYHTKAVAEAAAAYFAQLFPHAKTAANAPHIYVRGTDDNFTISLDTSGDMLYKRGLKNKGGAAPLRETLAYAVLQKAGYKGGPLLDPMCGSGTFSLEAALTAGNIAPGLAREFAFTQAPFFNAKQWDYFKRQACATQKPAPPEPLIVASDKDAEVIKTLKLIAAEQELETFIKVINKDFFELSPKTLFGRKTGLVVLNPPYGLRLLERAEAENLYGALCRKLTQDFKGWRYAVITPRKDWLNFNNIRWHKIWHGGLNLFLATGLA